MTWNSDADADADFWQNTVLQYDADANDNKVTVMFGMWVLPSAMKNGDN